MSLARRLWVPAAIAGFLPAAPAVADTPPPALVAPAPVAPCSVSATEVPCGSCDDGPLPRFYGSAEYLLWWVKGMPTPPLVSGNNDPATIAALTEPGTRVLFGGNSVDYDTVSGMRFTLGGWLNELVGLEGDGFYLAQSGTAYTASAAGGTGPVLAIPLFSTVAFAGNPVGETSLNPGGAPNSVRVGTDTRLWGANASVLFNLLTTPCYRLHALAGFKYLDLDETLSLSDTFSDPFGGGSLSVRDDFATRNQFYGGQFGLRAGRTFGRLALDLTGRLALGGNRQQSWVSGRTAVAGGAFGLADGTSPGGIFAQPSNSGRFSRNVFAVVPEGQARLTFAATSRLNVWAGYDFLYLDDAVRPGTQIDRRVNPTQATPLLAPTGAPAPLPAFTRTDYWAQGVSFGLALRY